MPAPIRILTRLSTSHAHKVKTLRIGKIHIFIKIVRLQNQSRHSKSPRFHLAICREPNNRGSKASTHARSHKPSYCGVRYNASPRAVTCSVPLRPAVPKYHSHNARGRGNKISRCSVKTPRYEYYNFNYQTDPHSLLPKLLYKPCVCICTSVCRNYM